MKVCRSRMCPICSSIGDFKCGRCKEVSYCGAEHQREHWEKHKSLCKAWLKLKDSESFQFDLVSRELMPVFTKRMLKKDHKIFYSLRYMNDQVIDKRDESIKVPLKVSRKANFYLPGLVFALNHTPITKESEWLLSPEVCYQPLKKLSTYLSQRKDDPVDTKTPLILKVKVLE